ncbi:uncharacterized protein TNIN_126081 [Trichonephila inaurata madagascariensis]|uniref:Uncharacterized protein n=1 Tax=Trichonephila inaurata madagascariensis TaxID=2747483 RepID=A0A8X6WQU9_9ARAC|nr:uncharacterized protein TNIN_126081 [Trichonephila inaurata madagascariensis]
MADNSASSTDSEIQVEDHKQSNGHLSKKEEEMLIFFSPQPQRVQRLNRRGFFLSSNEKVPKEKTVTKNSNDKKEKNYSVESEKSLKRNSSDSDLNEVNQDSQDVPAKKKHKVITWP